MTNTQAVERIKQKIGFLEQKMSAEPLAKASYWAAQDVAAFTLAIAALEYTEAMREYELSSPL